MKPYLSLIMGGLCVLSAYAQTPVSPNVTLEASKLLLNEGSFDKELLFEYVGTKQDEVKTEITKRVLAKSLVNSNIAINRFVGQNMDVLFTDAEPLVKKKELVKNASELALVIGFAEYYMQDLKKRINKMDAQVNNYLTMAYPDQNQVSKDEWDFILDYIRKLDRANQLNLTKTLFPKFDYDQTYFDNTIKDIQKTFEKSGMTENDFYENLSLEDKIYFSLSYYNVFGFSEFPPSKPEKQNSPLLFSQKELTDLPDSYSKASALNTEYAYLPKPIFLTSFKNTNSWAAESKTNGKFNGPNHLLIDMVFAVLSENEGVLGFGFFQRKAFESGYESKYQQLIKNKNPATTTYWKPLESKLDNMATNLVKYYELIEKVGELVKSDGDDLKTLFNTGKGLEKEELKKTANVIVDELEKLALTNTKLTQEQTKMIRDLVVALGKINDEIKSVNDYINYLESTLIPALITFKIDDPKFKDVLKETKVLQNTLLASGIYQVVKDHFGPNLDYETAQVKQKLTALIDTYEPYLQLLKYLSNLDEAITYDRIFKFIADLGDICADNAVGKVLNTMVNYMDEYAVIDQTTNSMTIDLEGITNDLYAHYQQNADSRIMFSFTVGINNAVPMFGRDSINITGDSTGVNLGSASFVSEKIGVKWNMIDFNRRYMKGKRNSKPLINDIHSLVYVSGLLYQIEALNTEDKFNFTSLGVGTGITFFNGLDLNLSYAGNISSWKKNNYLNIGFDIQITEYLGALNKKRQQKQLAADN